MSRLFMTSRELDFISDLNKEIIKDVVGQKVYYYRVLEKSAKVHEVYEETAKKVFDIPIEIDARVKYLPAEIRTNRFGTENFYTIEVFLHERDLIDRDLQINIGDYFSYGEIFFEITSFIAENTIYGQIEHLKGYKLIGKQARLGQLNKTPLGPTNYGYTEDPNAVQKEFVQQRGFKENKLGPTDDKRELQENGVLDAPLTGPAEVSPLADNEGIKSSFYDET
jgi:hypothetical protein